MPVPAPNLYPEFNIVRLSHIELGVTDLRSSTFFYSEILGLQVTHQDSNQVFLRAMERVMRTDMTLELLGEMVMWNMIEKLWGMTIKVKQVANFGM